MFKRSNLIFYGGNIFGALVAGVLVYFLFRPDTYVSQVICSGLGIEWPVGVIGVFPDWIVVFLRNYMCDMFWAYALTFAVGALLHDVLGSSFSVLLVCGIFEIVIELSQEIGIMSGTFDMVDVVLEICITAFVTLIIKLKKLKKEI